MQSQIILLNNVKQDNVAPLVQKEFEMLGIANIKGKLIDADKVSIHKNVAEALADYNVIMVIGGMGEQNDNMTVSSVASAIGFSTVRTNGEIFPEGAEIFRNKDGKASGCAISQGNQCIIMLPGETETLPFMLCYRVSGYLADFIGGEYAIRNLRANGITRSEAEDAVSEAETSGTHVRVYEDGNEIAIQVYATGENKKEAAAKANASIRNIIEKTGSAAYAVGAENVGQAFGQELSKKDLKVAFALEGIQRSEIALAAHTEEYIGNYLGTSQGVSKYDIPDKLLERHGKNSTWTAAVLAGEVCKNYGSNIGISITADPEKTAEGAYIAVCMGDNVWTERVKAESYEELISVAASRAVHIARNVVSAYPKLYENSVSLVAAASGKSKFKTSESSGKQKWYSRFIPMKGDSKNELIRKSIFILCVVVFLGCMGYLSTKVFDSVKHRDLAANLQGLVNAEASEEELKEWGYNPKLYGLFKENPDTAGYIKIDNTNVDFPVVQTPVSNEKGQRGQYYLRKDFYGNYSMYGTPFIDYRCETKPEEQSTNIIVYGHNVYDDGQMFSDLLKYRKLSFYKENPVIHFDTLYGDFDWLVVGVILTNAYEKDGPVWNYNNFINGNEEETKEFLNQVAKRTLVVTGVDYNTSDHFLTLSTCSYDFTDARVVIIARQVREGEDVSNIDTSKAYYNSNPVMPDKWYQAVSQAQQSEADASFGEAEEIGSAAEVDEVDILSLPNKLEYNVGESIDLTGMMLGVYREDGSYSEVTSGFTADPGGPFESSGGIEIFIDYEGYYVGSFYIDVLGDKNEEVGSIEITQMPNKTTYVVGEKIENNPTGLIIRALKKDGSILEDNIITGFTVSADTSKAGPAKATVNYKGATATYDIVVKEPEVTVTKIEIVQKPTKLVYNTGEQIDTTGLVIKATKSDGSVQENITSGFEAVGDLSKPAEKAVITVNYQGATATYEVKVNAAEVKVTSIEITKLPDKVEYTVGDTFDSTGLVIKAIKSDGSVQENITSGFSVSLAGVLKEEGTKEVTVTYSECTAKFNIKVNPKQNSSVPDSSVPDSSVPDSSEPEITLPDDSSTEEPSGGNGSSGSAISGSGLSASSGSRSAYYEQSQKDKVTVSGKTMSVYDAVCQIVAYEAGNGQPDEHVKAQAVATYTYLMNEGGDVNAGTSTAKLDSQIERCVAEVIGYAVLDDRSDDFILATYFSESCGETADAEWVWGYANRNLLSVSSPVDGKSSKTYSISSSEFADKVKNKANITLTGDPADWIEVYSYWGDTDYVNKVNLGGKLYSARSLRESVLGGSKLRSTAFDVEYNESTDKFVFTMRGYGHGVGMSAVGSIAYAKQGYEWDEILLKYYSNCYIGYKEP